MIRLLLLSFFGFSEGTLLLKQLHVVTRHGSCCLPAPEGSPRTLTLLGQQQMFELGEWLHKTYRKSWDAFASYDPDMVRLTSSALDRTIVSAQSLAQGIWGGSSNDTLASSRVPVYMVGEHNDVTIRAHNKCPDGFDPMLDKLYQSNDWLDLKKQNMDVLRKLSSMPEFEDYVDADSNMIPLEDIWQVYDAINVAKTECENKRTSTKTCPAELKELSTILDDDDWFALETLTHAAEQKKYGSDTAGRLVGGNLWHEILDTAGDDNDDGFYLYSGHYPTLLGFLAAVSYEPKEAEVLPRDGAAVIVEVYEDSSTSDISVKVLYRPEAVRNATITVTLPMCGDKDECSLDSLSGVFDDLTVEQWCRECGNDSSDVCMKEIIKQTSSATSPPVSTDVAEPMACSNQGAGGAGVIGFVVGICVMLGLLLFFYFYRLYKSEKELDMHPKPGSEVNLAATRSASPTEMTDVDIEERYA